MSEPIMSQEELAKWTEALALARETSAYLQETSNLADRIYFQTKKQRENSQQAPLK